MLLISWRISKAVLKIRKIIFNTEELDSMFEKILFNFIFILVTIFFHLN